MPRRRTLSPEEKDLWRSVARTTRPMRAMPQAANPQPEAQSAVEPQLPAPKTPRIPALMLGVKHLGPEVRDLSPVLVDRLNEAPLRMDAGTHARMKRGKLAPEARIDLHGMTLAEAHPELIRFVLNAQSAGLRLVLVITGKGKRREDHGPIPQRMGALRHQVPHWLHLPPLGAAVQQVVEAHLRHGGSGAFYVYLRRS